jgi:hypothetical protein
VEVIWRLHLDFLFQDSTKKAKQQKEQNAIKIKEEQDNRQKVIEDKWSKELLPLRE